MASIPEGRTVLEQRTSANAHSQPTTPLTALPAQPLSAATSGGHEGESVDPQRGSQQCVKSPFQEDYVQAEADLQVSGGSSGNAAAGPSQQQQRSMSSAVEDGAGSLSGPTHPAETRGISGDPGSHGFLLPGQVASNGEASADQPFANGPNAREDLSLAKQLGTSGVEVLAGNSGVRTNHSY
jgi:hypothetical protein